MLSPGGNQEVDLPQWRNTVDVARGRRISGSTSLTDLSRPGAAALEKNPSPAGNIFPQSQLEPGAMA